jgi:hypothetical protein
VAAHQAADVARLRGTPFAHLSLMAKNSDNQPNERTRTRSAEDERDVVDQNDRADEQIVGETSDDEEDEDEDEAFEDDEDEDEDEETDADADEGA